MPPRDTQFTHSLVTQATEEKGEAKEAEESGNSSQVPAITVVSHATRALIVTTQVAVRIKAKEAKVGKVEKVFPWQ